MATKLYMVAPNICGSILASRILGWFQDFSEISTPLIYSICIYIYKMELHIQNRHYTSIIQPTTPFYTEVYRYVMSLE